MLPKQGLTPILCSALGTTCSRGSSRPSTWMPWMQSSEGPHRAAETPPFGASQGVAPSPAVLLHHFLRALTLAMRSCHSSTGPVPDRGSLGLERTLLSEAVRRTSFMENATFPHPRPHQPQRSAWLHGWSVQSCPVFPCLRVGVAFLMHHILFFPNTKNSN